MTEILSADWVLPVSAPPIEAGAIAIEDGRVVAVGPSAELGSGTRYPGAVILPGFVNAHSHLEYSVYAGFGDGLGDFAAWVDLHTQRKRRVGFEEMLDSARLGAAECLASGITTVADCSYSGAAGVAAAELGLRALVYLEVFGDDPEAALQQFGELRERVEPFLSAQVRVGISPHAPYSISPSVYRTCFELGLPVATHLSESASEVRYLHDGGGPWQGIDWLVDPPGTTGLRLLEREGLLDPRLLAVHCVVVEPDEIELLARNDVGVAHCPRSNAFLGCGIAPVAELIAAGVRVGLGTDSPTSTPSFDMFDELRAAIGLARLRAGRADALSATQALELATLGSARALGLDEEVGSLEPGKRADVAVVSLDDSPFLPWEDPATALVLGGSPERVLTTLVEGKVRYLRGEFEWHELRQNGASARSRLLAHAHRADVSAAAPSR